MRDSIVEESHLKIEKEAPLKKKIKKRELSRMVEFFFEAGHLARTPRTGFVHLGDFRQSVAEHTNRMIFIGFVLSEMSGADRARVVYMCLFHDLSEARCGDHGYLQQIYDKRDEEGALSDALKGLSFGEEVLAIFKEFERTETLEARIARDADQLELLLSLKPLIENGCTKAKTWIPNILKRLNTEEGRALAKTILRTSSDSWWYKNKEDSCWVNPEERKK